MFDTVWVYVIVGGLAVWRFSYMLIAETGPFHLFTFIREMVGIEHYKDGTPASYPETFFGELFSCIYCTSVWVAFLFWLLLLLHSGVAVVLATPFAISAIAIMFDSFVQK